MDLMSTAQLLGNFGEFFGAIAVVSTLIFLVWEIRRTRKQNLVDGAENRLKAWNDWGALLLSNPDVRQIYARGCRELAGLNDDELLVFNQLVIFRHTIIARMFTRANQLNDQESLEGARGLLRDIFGNEPGMKDWWRRYRNRWRPSFREFVDDVLSEATAATN